MTRRFDLVVADVDGTLLTHDKRLTTASQEAVEALDSAGIAFTVASSRPPIGLRMLVGPLRLRHPMGAFNGAATVAPDLSPLEAHTTPAPAARIAADVIRDFGVALWVYTHESWLIDDPAGDHVDWESRTVQAEPVVVDDLAPYLDRAAKIVGSSRDHERLARCEAAVREAVGDEANAARSQPYYLDVTPPGIDKGTLVRSLAARLGLDPARVMTVGDADNDVPMFQAAGLGVAMGNASPDVRARAGAVVATNDQDGFAEAVRRHALGG